MIDLDDLDWIGSGLRRPECALAHSSGLIFAPDWSEGGGVAVVSPDGRTRRIMAKGAPYPLRPNGIALEDGGTFLLAHLGEEIGGLWRMDAAGDAQPVLTAFEGAPLPPSNFPLADYKGRIWLTISTTIRPRADDYRKGAKTGHVILIDASGAHKVADGLGYANECAISPDGGTFYVNETFARRTAAFDLGPGGALANRRTFATYGAATYPDGMALDAMGALWITSIVSNRVIRVAPDGSQTTILEDADPDHVARAEAAWARDELGRPHLDRARSKRLKNISNLAFAGQGLQDAVLGCLLGDRLARFRSPVPGAPPPHWEADLGPLATFLE